MRATKLRPKLAKARMLMLGIFVVASVADKAIRPSKTPRFVRIVWDFEGSPGAAAQLLALKPGKTVSRSPLPRKENQHMGPPSFRC